LKGSFSIPLTLTAAFAPSPSLLVYCLLPRGGMAADSTRLDVAFCFDNQVKVELPAAEAQAGSPVQLQLQAAPGSLCAVHIFPGPAESQLSSQMVYGLFPAASRHGYPAQVEEQADPCATSPLARGRPQHPFQPGIFQLFQDAESPPAPHTCSSASSSSQQSMGLKIFSNLLRQKPSQCLPWLERKPGMGKPSPEEQKSTKEQAQFASHGIPDPWLWHLFSLGPNGSRSVLLTAPAAAAHWNINTFCLAGKGFGLAPSRSFRTLQAFSMDVSLPHSVTRGETFLLTARVSSSLQQCLQIQVGLDKSSDFHVEPCRSCRDKECLCPEESKAFSWNVTAAQLGAVSVSVGMELLDSPARCGGRKPLPAPMRRRHVVVKELLVKPEGVLVEKSYSSLLCPRAAKKAVSLQLPEDVAEGSARVSIAISGDLLGPALQNLGQLLHMPHGCGEQNMVLFAPTVYLLQYLEHTRQLSPAIKQRARGLLSNGNLAPAHPSSFSLGYQTQLLYRHQDGSYSAFGQQDGEGNTWLTAFVAKSFGQARRYMSVDEQLVQDALGWLQHNQLPNGCFAIRGSIFHSSLKGSLDEEITLGAYVAAALLEMGQPLKSKLMRTTLRCLQQAAHNITNIYTEALLAYAFALAGDYETTQQLLYKLEEQAIRSGGQIHWSPKPSSAASPELWPEPQAMDVELTAYVLLAYLCKPRLHAGELSTAAAAAGWLSQQHSSYGGFASSQDTVVALQALAKYAARTFSSSSQALVRVKTPRGLGKAFQVPRHKRLLVQQAELPELPGHLLLQLHGSSCVLAQVLLKYHQQSPRAAVSFSLRVSSQLANCSQASPSPAVLTLHILASYTGSRITSNMVIVEVSLLSGYVLAPSFRMLANTGRCSDFLPCVFSLPLHKLTDEPESFTLQLQQAIQVKKLKGGSIQVYDYYQPEERAWAGYRAVC
ncbi:A2ML1 protein, partial [Bucco capensis]|nr:A2ML1 protein [Bucco capensis]